MLLSLSRNLLELVRSLIIEVIIYTLERKSIKIGEHRSRCYDVIFLETIMIGVNYFAVKIFHEIFEQKRQ